MLPTWSWRCKRLAGLAQNRRVEMSNYGKLFIILGLIFLAIGGLIYLAGKINLPLGRLPGDIRLQFGNVTCFFPLATSIIISILLTIVLSVLARLMNK